MGTISILQIDPTCPCILCLYGQLNIFCVFCINMSKSVRVQFTMRFSGAGGFASLCRKSRLCGGLGGKKGGGGQEVGAAVVLCAMELVGFRENGLIH